MITYRRFVETCDSEGERWTFWLQLDGNWTALAILGDRLAALNNGQIDVAFELMDDQIDEREVAVLIRFAESGYMKQHNKVDGSMSLPKGLAEMDRETLTDHLRKGGIEQFFTGGAK